MLDGFGLVGNREELPEDHGLSRSLGSGCDPQWIEVCCSTGSSGVVTWHRPPLLTFNGPRPTFSTREQYRDFTRERLKFLVAGHRANLVFKSSEIRCLLL